MKRSVLSVDEEEGGLLRQGLKLFCADKDAAGLIGPRFETIHSLLSSYLDEIERFNPVYGLVKAESRREFVIRHILDSLAPLGCFLRLMAGTHSPLGRRGLIADIGSGAGLPGIPLAICMPDADFSLVERMGRRAGFLRNAAAVLGLSNLAVQEDDLEKFAAGPAAGTCGLVVFRALSPLKPALVRRLSRLLAPESQGKSGGVIAAYKGRREKAAAEWPACPGRLAADPEDCKGEIIDLRVPFLDEERCLVLLRPSMLESA